MWHQKGLKFPAAIATSTKASYSFLHLEIAGSQNEVEISTASSISFFMDLSGEQKEYEQRDLRENVT